MHHALLVGRNLLHAVQGAASLEPFDLLLVERVVQLNLMHLTVGLDLTVQLLARGKVVQAQDRDLRGRLNLRERKSKTPTLNSVRFKFVALFTLS